MAEQEPSDERERARLARAARLLRRADAHPALLGATRATRRLLPGDARFGDELSTAGDRMAQIIGRLAVFAAPADAVAAALEIQRRVATIEVAGHRPVLRAGVHCGRPRRVGRDYLGVDVNVAARVAAAADGGEVLVSESAHAGLDPDSVSSKRRRRFRAKGAPRDLVVYAVRAPG